MRRLPSRLRSRLSRHTVRLPCQIVRERDFKLIAAELFDLSATGVLAVPTEAVLTGERVWVSFQLPRTNIWVDTLGTVARVLHGRRPGELSRGLGIEFDPLRPLLGFLLKRILDTCPRVPPASRPGRRNAWGLAEALVGAANGPIQPMQTLVCAA
jgi:hypothetical protein